MTSPSAETLASAAKAPALVVIPMLGVTQILAWGSTYYLLAVLAKPIAGDTGWPLAWVVGGLSLGLLTAGLVSPRVGDSIQRHGGRPVLAASAVLFGLGLVGLGLAPDRVRPELMEFSRGGHNLPLVSWFGKCNIAKAWACYTLHTQPRNVGYRGS